MYKYNVFYIYIYIYIYFYLNFLYNTILLKYISITSNQYTMEHSIIPENDNLHYL